VTLTVQAVDGTARDLCVLLAATEDDRATGLMGVTSLQGFDGMAFTYEAPATGTFWMYRTLLPLSIAFFDAGGRFVSSTDMAPCEAANPAECARYGPAGPYTLAVETEQGRHEGFGIGPGATAVLGDPCTR
jgi:uncharacterized protein